MMAMPSNPFRLDFDRCPACRTQLRADPSEPFGDARCPRCKLLLWHITIHSHTVFTADPVIKDRILDFLAERLKISRQEIESSPHLLRRLRADSLDDVELVMQIEEAMDTEWPA